MNRFSLGAVLSLLLVLCQCTDSSDTSQIEVGPDGKVSWEDAKTIIKDRDVETVFQSHAREVRITMADGTKYQTTEPQIDDVIAWVKECGKKDSIAIMTE